MALTAQGKTSMLITLREALRCWKQTVALFDTSSSQNLSRSGCRLPVTPESEQQADPFRFLTQEIYLVDD
jgi:hypothetical protein